jgi:hypothetical protein
MAVTELTPALSTTALLLRLVARRHVDLHRVNSALCRTAC